MAFDELIETIHLRLYINLLPLKKACGHHINAQNSKTIGKLIGHVNPIRIAVKILIFIEGSAQALKVSSAEMTEPIKYTVLTKAHAAGYI
ncbi:hypothetical protein RN38_09830 [Hafnia paralvei]|jgi:hypothetical protein|uniref:hypothetical protein n=1 Tax=Hafnia paralvei TaxID=546367 RepID=UPI000580A7CD|nr:hypothetical protein RN38_09830 [Hafnia paralvei]